MVRPLKNQSGKIILVFLVIAAILLTSLAAISMFLFQKEIDKRTRAENALTEKLDENKKMSQELEALQKEKSLLENKNKEADAKINNLLDELELQEGLRSEINNESANLRKQIDSLTKQIDQLKSERDQLVGQSEDAASLKKNVDEMQALINTEKTAKESLNTQLAALMERNGQLEKEVKALQSKLTEYAEQVLGKENAGKMDWKKSTKEESLELPKIVVGDNKGSSGRVLSVDSDAEFIIINLGSKDGVKQNQILSVYRGKEYLGDVKATRIQPEMSAADFMPPFSSRLVRKNDQVVAK